MKMAIFIAAKARQESELERERLLLSLLLSTASGAIRSSHSRILIIYANWQPGA